MLSMQHAHIADITSGIIGFTLNLMRNMVTETVQSVIADGRLGYQIWFIIKENFIYPTDSFYNVFPFNRKKYKRAINYGHVIEQILGLNYDLTNILK